MGKAVGPYTDESALFCPDSSINNEAQCEWATGVPTWFGFPHYGDNGNMVVGVLVLLFPFVAVVGSSAQPSDQSAGKEVIFRKFGGGEDPPEIARSRANRSLISLFSAQDGSSGNGIGYQPHGGL